MDLNAKAIHISLVWKLYLALESILLQAIFTLCTDSSQSLQYNRFQMIHLIGSKLLKIAQVDTMNFSSVSI